jgi:hypothetical protein
VCYNQEKDIIPFLIPLIYENDRLRQTPTDHFHQSLRSDEKQPDSAQKIAAHQPPNM